MERLGVRTKNPRDDCFVRLSEKDFTAIASEDLANAAGVSLVDFGTGPRLDFPLRYRNSTFLVYEVSKR